MYCLIQIITQEMNLYDNEKNVGISKMLSFKYLMFIDSTTTIESNSAINKESDSETRHKKVYYFSDYYSKKISIQ